MNTLHTAELAAITGGLTDEEINDMVQAMIEDFVQWLAYDLSLAA
jgi:bacteriocin-like protein